EQVNTNQRQLNEYGYPSLGAKRSDRSGSRRSETGSYKEQCSKSSNRSSSVNSRLKATVLGPGKGCKDALRRVDELLRSGKHWVLDADLKSYFDTIPHERLMERVAEKV